MTFSNVVNNLLVDSVRPFAARPETRIRRSRMSSAGLVFYREVCRAIRKLPKETQSYYRVVAREKVVAHRDEDVPDRIDSIIRRSREDVAWVLKKYSPIEKQASTSR